ncbi:hypothetical protein [Saccharothrix obliqua]|uniref:hypothetical protein n=1 Tax=Saccharothrix obliqua TaxID=2861747 RepID=UPI001C5DBA28|nr:hypothetical protein [Saccharothrix obliqua]MBW4717133.1 hypothetical protein [Saccharothrix obliqua]
MRNLLSARSRRWLAGASAAVLLAGCTIGSADSTSTTGANAPVAEVVVPSGPTTVLDARPGVESAVAASAALFRSAPVVVVASAGDEKAVRTAGAAAERLGVPVLLTAAGGPEEVRREVTRLAPGSVVAVGADARREVEAWGGPASVVGVDATADGTSPEGLPATRAPEPAGVTVLVDPDRDDATAIATARAARAEVVTVRGADPRADPAVVEQLHRRPAGSVLALGGRFGSGERLRARLDTAAQAPALPGGGQLVLPGRRLVCLYGHPGAPVLGVLGEQDVEESITRAKELAKQYEPLSDVPVTPAFEIIATVAQGDPGPDGDYSGEAEVETLLPWVRRASEAGLYVVLDLQPGRAALVDQAKRYASLLEMPNVGLAIDPEWKLGPDQVPLRQIGGVDAAEINEVTTWLADLTARAKLPQKLVVVHQFQLTMIRDEQALDTSRDELAVLIHMDGQGSTAQKDDTWAAVVGARPGDLPLGWKNFYDEDHPMLTPEQTMTRRPTPVMISYQ